MCCGFEIGYCDKAFPFAAPPLALLLDPSKLLPTGVEAGIQKTYRKVRKRFPQVDYSFCFVRLQEGIETPEFAFWLHNNAPAADQERAWRILVVGDLNSGRLSLTVGYALEPFLAADQWEAALQELAACIADDQWKEGLCGFLVDARDLLTLAWSAAEARRETLPRETEPERAAGDLARDPNIAAAADSAPPDPAPPSNPSRPAAAPQPVGATAKSQC